MSHTAFSSTLSLQRLVEVNLVKAQALATLLGPEQILEESRVTRPPLAFHSFRKQVNFLCFTQLLSIGSQYETEVETASLGSSRDEIVLFGALSCYHR